jgi:hypothetical protein
VGETKAGRAPFVAQDKEVSLLHGLACGIQAGDFDRGIILGELC